MENVHTLASIAMSVAASSGCRRWSDGTTDEARQLFAVSKNEDFYSERTEAMTPPGFALAFYEANK